MNNKHKHMVFQSQSVLNGEFTKWRWTEEH